MKTSVFLTVMYVSVIVVAVLLLSFDYKWRKDRAMFEAKCAAAGGLVFTGSNISKCIKPNSEITVD